MCAFGRGMSAAGTGPDSVEAEFDGMGVVVKRQGVEKVFGLSTAMPADTTERRGDGVPGVVSRRH